MKARLRYIAAVLIAMILGLCSREFPSYLPAFVYSHAGDSLWACMIYFGVRALLVNRRCSWAVGISLVFCFAIECSQLYQADWINSIRSTLIGGLVLGKGFLYMDFVRYTVGILLASIVDRYFMLTKQKGNTL